MGLPSHVLLVHAAGRAAGSSTSRAASACIPSIVCRSDSDVAADQA